MLNLIASKYVNIIICFIFFFQRLSTEEVSEERQDHIKLKERIGKLKNENGKKL